MATRKISDRKLKGQLRYSEKLAAEAAQKAAKAEEWLLPNEAGVLEAEGLERTWRFSQVRLHHRQVSQCSSRLNSSVSSVSSRPDNQDCL